MLVSEKQYGLICGVIEKWLRETQNMDAAHAKDVRRNIFNVLWPATNRRMSSDEGHWMIEHFFDADEDGKFTVNGRGAAFILKQYDKLLKTAGQISLLNEEEK